MRGGSGDSPAQCRQMCWDSSVRLLRHSPPFFLLLLGTQRHALAWGEPLCPRPNTVHYRGARPCSRWCPVPSPTAALGLSPKALPPSVSLSGLQFVIRWRLNVFCSLGLCVAPAPLCLLEPSWPVPALCHPLSRHQQAATSPPSLLMPPSSLPRHRSCPCPPLPTGFYKNETNLLVFIYKHSFIGLLPCVRFFSSLLSCPPAFRSAASSQQDAAPCA